MDVTINHNGEELDVTISWYIESEVNENGFTVWQIADIWVTHVNGVAIDRKEAGKYYDDVMTEDMDDKIRTWIS
jgi:hypothetical protein